ncbi:MAG TPA: carbohydrate-binding protein [Vicinamibacteria bacterium]|nr:carbohydrate-binding protein [Vicinamibacteria bacterium]
MRRAALAAALLLLATPFARAGLPEGYRGKPFADEFHKTGVPAIPGIVQAALYDLGGEGVAYHDTTPTNEGSAGLNTKPEHQRPHASAYLWGFRRDEAVDISYVKDIADLNHPNLVSPHINQLYLGWTDDGEWTNYTVDVKTPGRYRIKAMYSYQANTVSFDVNGRKAAECRLPVATEDWHHWNLAEVGTIAFEATGVQLLTFHYGRGNNFAWFEFERVP